MLPLGDNVSYLVGDRNTILDKRALRPYDNLVCEFLSALSLNLLKNREAKQYSDVISFAFWCRKANIAKLKNQFAEQYIRLGLGAVFHITPSNVPVNFAFSYACSLLAGNANIVRVPSKPFRQIDIICNAIKELFQCSQFKILADMTVFLRYDRDDAITSLLSLDCNARIIWGGDDSIRQIRQLPISERSREITFADRYSFCVINAKKIFELNKEQLKQLAINFYNDTYLMDQNACSSPSLVVWLGNSNDVNSAKEQFWKAVLEEVRGNYELAPVNGIDKYTHLCQNAIDLANITTVEKYGNYIYCIGLDAINETMDMLRGKFGYFYEYSAENINSIVHIVNSKYQTLTYFGMDKQVFVDFTINNRISGIDRIVPIGSALDISVIWDGYDLVRSLSRIIDIK